MQNQMPAAMQVVRHRRRRGFTLVELLVVMATVAILMSLVLGALVFIRARARVAECGNNARQIVIAARNWASRERPYNMFPPGPPNSRRPYDYFSYAGAPTAGVGTNLAQTVLYDGTADDRFKYRNHGWLFQRRDVANENVFYCPDQASEFFGNTPVSGFTDNAGDTRWNKPGLIVRSSYAYRTSLQAQIGIVATSRALQTDLDDGRVAAVSDAFTVSGLADDSRLAHGNNRYTVAKADGSTVMYEDPGKVIEIQNLPEATSLGDFASYEDATNGPWTLFSKNQ